MAEWAIRLEDRWWDASGSGVTKDPAHAARFTSYLEACRRIVEFSAENVRIVEAPPREMTDAEAWEWFEKRSPGSAVLFFDAGVGYRISARGMPSAVDGSATPCDAIRAAAKAVR